MIIKINLFWSKLILKAFVNTVWIVSVYKYSQICVPHGFFWHHRHKRLKPIKLFFPKKLLVFDLTAVYIFSYWQYKLRKYIYSGFSCDISEAQISDDTYTPLTVKCKMFLLDKIKFKVGWIMARRALRLAINKNKAIYWNCKMMTLTQTHGVSVTKLWPTNSVPTLYLPSWMRPS